MTPDGWLDRLGMRPKTPHAWTVSVAEPGAGVVPVLGLRPAGLPAASS